MNDHPLYIWSAYGIALLVLLANIFLAYWKLRRTLKRLTSGGRR